MKNQPNNQAYQLKLSDLRVHVSQELIQLSVKLKEGAQLLNQYLINPNPSQKTAIKKSFLAIGTRLDLLHSTSLVLNNRIDRLVINFKGNETQRQAVEILKLDMPTNKESIDILKQHYLELINIYGSTGEKTTQFKNFDYFKETEASTASDEPIKAKKHKWFCA